MLEQINQALTEMGYPGLILLMFLENLFPPIPSEVIMPMAGLAAAKGTMSLPLVILSGSLGSLLGAMPWYYAGRIMGKARISLLINRYGRWLGMSLDEFNKASGWFDKYGHFAVLFGRMMPAIRTLISIPAGICRMPLWILTLYTTIGSLGWSAFLAYIGYSLQSHYTDISSYIELASRIIVGSIVAVYIYKVVTFKKSETGGS